MHLREFLVALSVGYILHIIPALDSDKADPKDVIVSMSSKEDSFNTLLLQRQGDIKEVLELLVSSYILFDPQNSGCINRDVVNQIIREKQKKMNLDLMFSTERWDNLGWDENGNIDFGEFIFSFTSWVDLFED